MPYAGQLHYRDVGEGAPPIVVLHACTAIVSRFVDVLGKG
jgi:hypothetical protein